jgi:GAF domain-containing protein
VTSSRKGAKSRAHGRKLRSTGTKARTRVGRVHEPRTELEKKLEAHARELEMKLDASTRELGEARDHLAEALEQQTATSEVLSTISTSPGDLEPVFETMLANATRLCEATFGVLYLFQGDVFRAVSIHGGPPSWVESRRRNPVVRPIQGTGLGRVAATRQTVQIADAQAEPGYRGSPEHVIAVELGGIRTVLSVPMLKDGELIGAFNLHRQTVRPFTDKQVDLVTNFAKQAVIAIENTRLLNELRESLQQQTATSEVLRVISSSPSELERVFQAILENATQICGAKFGNLFLRERDAFRVVATHGAPAEHAEFQRREPLVLDHPHIPLGRVAQTKEVVHVRDLRAEQAYLDRHPRMIKVIETSGARTLLAVPMLQEGSSLIGAIAIYRQEVRPFTDKTSGELEPVFQTMLANATRICEAKFGTLALYDGEAFRTVALHNAPPAYAEERQRNPVIRPRPTSGLGRLAATRQVVHITDIREDQAYLEGIPSSVALADTAGARTVVVVPMLKDDQLVGAIAIYRQEVRPFTDKQIELVTSFAKQAVIAIENTRLLNELRQRTDDLSESLQQQTATSEVLQVISTSRGELQAVFQTILANATRICQAKFGMLYLRDGDAFYAVATHNAPPAFVAARKRGPVRPPPEAPLGRVALTKQVVHIADIKRTSYISSAIHLPSRPWNSAVTGPCSTCR